MSTEAFLRTGASVIHAIEVVRDLAQRARNAAAGGRAVEFVRDDYLTWVEDAEIKLRTLFASDHIWQDLHTARHWNIRTLSESSARPFPVIAHEAQWQAQRLEALAIELEQRHKHLVVPQQCTPAILDTNVIAHYQRFDQIDWPKLLDTQQVRIVIPLIVLDELDDLSYRSTNGGARAKRRLRFMQTARGESPPEIPVDVREGVAFQIMMDPRGHVRTENNDEEIMRQAEIASSMTGESVVLVTGDYGMQLRAASRGIRWLMLPGSLRLDSPTRETAT